MREERLAVISLIENDRISVVDGKRLLEMLASDEEKTQAPGYSEMRLHVLHWLGRYQLNAAQAIELISLINNIATEHSADNVIQELKSVLQLKEENIIETHTVIRILDILQLLFGTDNDEFSRKERLEILNLVQKQKITGTTAIELLQALNPEKNSSASGSISTIRQTATHIPNFTAPLNRTLRDGIRRIFPEQTRQTADKAEGRAADLRTAIQREVQQVLDAGRQTAAGSVKPTQVVSTPTAETEASKTILDPLMDRLHDQLRDLELASRALEQNWFTLNQTPTPSNFESQLQRLRGSLGNMHRKLAQISESKAALELHLNSVEEGERRYALELIEYTQKHYTKNVERLQELDNGVAELSTISHMQHEETLRNLHNDDTPNNLGI